MKATLHSFKTKHLWHNFLVRSLVGEVELAEGKQPSFFFKRTTEPIRVKGFVYVSAGRFQEIRAEIESGTSMSSEAVIARGRSEGFAGTGGVVMYFPLERKDEIDFIEDVLEIRVADIE